MDGVELAERFKTASLKGDYDLLVSAVDALALATGSVDLSKEDAEANGTIGERLADHVGKTSEEALALRLKLAPQFHKLVLNDTASQRILSMLLAYLHVCGDAVLFRELEKFIPSDIRNPGLAYNLACAAACRGDKDAMLKYTATALELGKSPKQFREDSDFKNYLTDSTFAAWLDGKSGPLVGLRREKTHAQRIYKVRFAAWRVLNVLPSVRQFALGFICLAIFAPAAAWVDYAVQHSSISFANLLAGNALFGIAGIFVVTVGGNIYVECGYKRSVSIVCFLLGFGVLYFVKSRLNSHLMIDFSHPMLMAAVSPLIPVAAAGVGYVILSVLLKGTFHH